MATIKKKIQQRSAKVKRQDEVSFKGREATAWEHSPPYRERKQRASLNPLTIKAVISGPEKPRHGDSVVSVHMGRRFWGSCLFNFCWEDSPLISEWGHVQLCFKTHQLHNPRSCGQVLPNASTTLWNNNVQVCNIKTTQSKYLKPLS